jgi:hypothetical protein
MHRQWLLVWHQKLLLLRLVLGSHPNASASWLLEWLKHPGPTKTEAVTANSTT